MPIRTIIALAVAAILIALGIAINDGASAISTPLIILGGATVAVCISLWAARAMGLGRAVVRNRRDSARIDALIAELSDCARQADTRGVLTLTERTIPDRRALFAEGVAMLINADSPAIIRARLSDRVERNSVSFHTARARITTFCRVVPIVAMAMALTTMIWMLAAALRPNQLGSLTPLALIIAVYGAFAIAAVSVEMGDRAAAAVAEDELAGALVIETIAAIRAGESADRVAAILRGLTPPPQHAADAMPLRRAA